LGALAAWHGVGLKLWLMLPVVAVAQAGAEVETREAMMKTVGSQTNI
jgi:hypothetical protein